jgi:hypothetical protein
MRLPSKVTIRQVRDVRNERVPVMLVLCICDVSFMFYTMMTSLIVHRTQYLGYADIAVTFSFHCNASAPLRRVKGFDSSSTQVQNYPIETSRQPYERSTMCHTTRSVIHFYQLLFRTMIPKRHVDLQDDFSTYTTSSATEENSILLVSSAKSYDDEKIRDEQKNNRIHVQAPNEISVDSIFNSIATGLMSGKSTTVEKALAEIADRCWNGAPESKKNCEKVFALGGHLLIGHGKSWCLIRSQKG